jgi:hypothetical protein
MTRRMLDSRRFTNESYASMPIAARHLQDGMVNIADDQGRLKANPIYLRNEIFPYDDVPVEQIQVWLNLMVVNGTILLYQANGRDYVQFNNWWLYKSLTFARPSDYPSPEGWEDRICINGKSNISLTHNWSKADGTRVKDTCDATGKPLPFVVEIIAAKKAAPRQTKQIEAESTPEVYTQAYTQAYTSVYTQAYTPEYTQVNKQEVETEVETEVEDQSNNNRRGAHEAETDVVVASPLLETDVVVALKAFGISEGVAKGLVVIYGPEHIRQKISYLIYLVDHRPDKAKNPCGWLRKAIEEDYGPPDGFHQRDPDDAAHRAKYTALNYLLKPLDEDTP